MAGYVKGTSAQAEMASIREAAARAGAAMLAWPDVLQAFADAGELGELGSQLSREAGEFRSFLAAALVDQRGMSPSQLAQILNLTPARVSQSVAKGRKQQKGNPVTDPGTLEEQPVLALAIITSGDGVLIEHRRDGIPPWTFPAGEVNPGETAAACLARRVPEETGIPVRPVTLFGRRVHPRTARYTVYLACEVLASAKAGTEAEQDARPQVLDTEDLDDVRWASLDEVKEKMPDMYPPVRAHLEAVLGGSSRS